MSIIKTEYILNLLIQADSSTGAITELNKYARSNNLKLENNWIRIILSEFLKLSSFKGSKLTGLNHLIELAQDLKINGSKIGYTIYANKAWNQIIKLRSPLDRLSQRQCENCGCIYAYTVIGEFVDLATFNCTKCFNLYVGSSFEVDKEIKCGKGNLLVFGKCPKCMSKNYVNEESISPYQYFTQKKFIINQHDCCEK